jgi:hypothetical protein
MQLTENGSVGTYVTVVRALNERANMLSKDDSRGLYPYQTIDVSNPAFKKTLEKA